MLTGLVVIFMAAFVLVWWHTVDDGLRALSIFGGRSINERGSARTTRAVWATVVTTRFEPV